jgi:hypothetical protein
MVLFLEISPFVQAEQGQPQHIRQINQMFNFFNIKISFGFDFQSKLKRFILPKHNYIHKHQHPSMPTCFYASLDHPQTNI